MRIQWITAAVLSSALVVGCGSKNDENAGNTEESQAVPATDAQVAPAEPAPSLPADSSAVPSRADQPRATTGNRVSGTTRPRAAAPRIEPAPRAEAPPARDAFENRRDVAPAPRVVVREVTIPAGTSLPLELTTAVSTETAQVESPVSARLRQSVVVDGDTALPAGAVFHGEVIEVDRPGRVQGRAHLGIRFTSVAYGGERIDLRTNPLNWEGEQSKGEDATKIGAGAGGGAIIGGILGGGKGAAKGAAIGGAAGTGAVMATRGKDIDLPAGTDVVATVASPVDVRVR